MVGPNGTMSVHNQDTDTADNERRMETLLAGVEDLPAVLRNRIKKILKDKGCTK
jgi:hypothetical protein